MARKLTRLYPIDVNRLPWRTPEGAPAGVEERVLSDDPDSGAKTTHTRFAAGTEIETHQHAHWEEIWVLEGEYVLDGRAFGPGSFICRRPGSDHGPVSSPQGCLFIRMVDFHGPAMDKPDAALDADEIAALEWERPDGSPEGVEQKFLVQSPDGSASRVLNVAPGADTGIFNHDHTEEVTIIAGSYKMGEEFHPTWTYTWKGPDVDHGPFLTDDGYVCLEIRNYES